MPWIYFILSIYYSFLKTFCNKNLVKECLKKVVGGAAGGGQPKLLVFFAFY